MPPLSGFTVLQFLLLISENIQFHVFYTVFSCLWQGGKLRPCYSFLARSPSFKFFNLSYIFHLTVSSFQLSFHLPLICYLTIPWNFKYHLLYFSFLEVLFASLDLLGYLLQSHILCLYADILNPSLFSLLTLSLFYIVYLIIPKSDVFCQADFGIMTC